MSFFSELDIDAQTCDCERCHGSIAQSNGRRAPMCVFSDEALGQRPARHVIADRRQDADQAHWSATDDRYADVPAHILNGEAPRLGSLRRAQ